MKRLLRIGSGLFVYSIIPILSWIVLSQVVGDSRISNVFSITYALQFVWTILKLFFGSGANIRKEKEKDENAVLNGMFWGTIFSALIFSIPLVFVDKYIAFFGQDAEFYRIYVIFGVALLFLQVAFSFVIEKLYFEDKEKLANIHLFVFNITNFVVLIFLVWLIKITWLALLITLAVLLVYVIVLYIWQFRKFKIDFKFFKNFKYESANIFSALFSFCIFLFAYKYVFSAGEEYLVALNLVSLCTDTQWDCLGAISTVAKVDISKNRFDYKQELKNSYIFSAIIMLSSIVMTFGLFSVYNANLSLVVIFLLFELLDMVLWTYVASMTVVVQLEYSAVLNTGLCLGCKAIRTILSLVLMTAFCTVIGQVVETVLLFVVLLTIRFVKFRLVGGKLKNKNSNVDDWVVKRFKDYCREEFFSN